MKKYMLLLAITIAAIVVSFNSFAFTPPTPTGYVTDLAGKLSDSQLKQLNSKLEDLNKSTKNEFAGLIIPSLNGESIEDVANSTFKSWKIGKAGIDNGVLVVIAIAERKSRIETGKGVEGDLTDLQANDILKNTLAPYLKRGDFYGGLNATFDSLSSTIESRHSTKAVAVPDSKSSNDKNFPITSAVIFVSLFGSVFGFFIIYSLLNRRANQKRLEHELKMEAEYSREKQLYMLKLAQDRSKLVEDNKKQLANKQKEEYNASIKGKPSPTTKKSRASIVTVPSRPAVAAVVSRKVDSGYAERQKIENRRRREEEEADIFRRDRERRREEEEESRRRRDSDSSSFGSSWGSSSDSGSSFGGFGGGDSGGGGSSSDW